MSIVFHKVDYVVFLNFETILIFASTSIHIIIFHPHAFCGAGDHWSCLNTNDTDPFIA